MNTLELNNLELNSQFQEALDLMNQTMENIFITGKAGTGKSTLLSYFIKQNKKPIAVLAPTGVAALNIQGETIHSFFKFLPNITPEMAVKKGKQYAKSQLFQNLQTIIIDEISMVRADLMDCIDEFLQAAKNIYEPFGGVQMIFIGDLHQLPPVVTPHERFHFTNVYKSAWFFDSNVFQNHNFRLSFIELQKIYRQKDAEFIDVLNAFRTNKAQAHHISTINSRISTIEDDEAIYLTSTNDRANEINQSRLDQLKSSTKSFKSTAKGEMELKQLPTEKSLGLKVGAQVMFVNNDSADRWVNGTIGKVTKINSNSISVEIGKNNTVDVTPHTWELYKHTYDENASSLRQVSVGSFTQIPVKLAWAITIHKSQGKTFDKVKIDLGRGSFASGQTYVALSRCRTLEGISLANLIKASDIQLDWRIENFLNSFHAPTANQDIDEFWD
jgi:ATP-dependent DNA helicase PIF1